ncbi:MAG TPA: hypothetical protein DCZ69_16725 [Syntrophobacteraceae bacterium]|jgi:hypothetical protein|nr:hypothetical protein [Syntrophobacteraceae bacterium]HBD09896.1 hypothetical protein [Syntrophobacteraceae bacterium]HBZ55988.1 hypothetical protein [Syntrophobacteraceae bacterium]
MFVFSEFIVPPKVIHKPSLNVSVRPTFLDSPPDPAGMVDVPEMPVALVLLSDFLRVPCLPKRHVMKG